MNNIQWNLKSEDLTNAINIIKGEKELTGNDCIGNLYIDNYMIDFTLRGYDNIIACDYDVYEKGIDSGYGYLEDGTPYDYKDGGRIFDKTNIPNSREEFENISLNIIEDFIKNIS